MSHGPVTHREPVCPSVHPAVVSTGVLLRLAPRRVSGFLTHVHQKRKGAAGCPSFPAVSPDRRRPCEPCAAGQVPAVVECSTVGDGVAYPESCALSGRGEHPDKTGFPGRRKGAWRPDAEEHCPARAPSAPLKKLLEDILKTVGKQSGKGGHARRGV